MNGKGTVNGVGGSPEQVGINYYTSCFFLNYLSLNSIL